jgi:plasmid stabilization system protein ParE
MIQVIWTEEALHCVAEIYSYIAQDSPKNAEYFLNNLMNSTEKQLKLSLYIGRITPEFENPMKREIIYRNY